MDGGNYSKETESNIIGARVLRPRVAATSYQAGEPTNEAKIVKMMGFIAMISDNFFGEMKNWHEEQHPKIDESLRYHIELKEGENLGPQPETPRYMVANAKTLKHWNTDELPRFLINEEEEIKRQIRQSQHKTQRHGEKDN